MQKKIKLSRKIFLVLIFSLFINFVLKINPNANASQIGCCQKFNTIIAEGMTIQGVPQQCWNARPENCSFPASESNWWFKPEACTSIEECTNRIQPPTEARCDNNGCIEQVCTGDSCRDITPQELLDRSNEAKVSKISADINVKKPLLEINIPGLNFSNTASSSDETGTYLYIPWIQELISALYKFGIAIVSIVAVVIIIIQGLRVIVSAGGEAKNEAYKKIFQSIIGLVIAWGSYAILYNINPALVQFSALKVKVIQEIPLDFATAELAPTVGVNAPTQQSSSANLVKFCTDVESCKSTCASWHCGTRTSADNCDLNSMPKDGSGIIAPDSPDLISSSRWPKMRNIDFGTDLKASQLVIDGLMKADNYLNDSSKPNGGKGYRIKINNCWRDWRKDAARECGFIMQDKDPNAAGLAWPGANPHSSGQACDLFLYDQNHNSMTQAGTSLILQGCDKWQTGSKILDEILTDPSVGGRRLVFEQWHYEWGNIDSCRCLNAEDCARYWRPSGAKCTPGPFNIPQPDGC